MILSPVGHCRCTTNNELISYWQQGKCICGEKKLGVWLARGGGDAFSPSFYDRPRRTGVAMQALLVIAVVLLFVFLALGVRIMSQATDNLAAAVSRLSTSVDAAVTKIQTPADETAVQAAADAINAASDKLDAANPPA